MRDDVLEPGCPGGQLQLAEWLSLELTLAQDVQVWLGDPGLPSAHRPVLDLDLRHREVLWVACREPRIDA